MFTIILHIPLGSPKTLTIGKALAHARQGKRQTNAMKDSAMKDSAMKDSAMKANFTPSGTPAQLGTKGGFTARGTCNLSFNAAAAGLDSSG